MTFTLEKQETLQSAICNGFQSINGIIPFFFLQPLVLYCLTDFWANRWRSSHCWKKSSCENSIRCGGGDTVLCLVTAQDDTCTHRQRDTDTFDDMMAVMRKGSWVRRSLWRRGVSSVALISRLTGTSFMYHLVGDCNSVAGWGRG